MFDVKEVFTGKKRLVGLDIGSNSLKLAEIVGSSRGPVLNRFFQRPLPKGVIVEGNVEDPRALTAHIKELLRNSGCKGRGIVTSLSGNAVIIKKVAFAQMEEPELRDLIRDEAGKYLPFDNMAEVNYDFQILGDNEYNPNQMDVILVAAKKTDINNYLDPLAAAGLAVNILDVDSFALETMYEANYDFEDNEIVVIVNIGASITNINIIKNGMSIFTRDFTLGGNSVTEALQEKYRISFDEAETIKLEGVAGSDQDGEALLSAVLESADPICLEIERSIDYFRSTFGGDYIKHVYLAGGSARIPGLTESLSQRLNIETELVNPLLKISFNKKNIDATKIEDIKTVGAVAIGLGLRKIGDK